MATEIPNIFVPHRRCGPMLPGRLLSRPNRFLTVVRLEDGGEVEAHLGDRGRLEGILFPGAEVHLVLAEGAARRTRFTLVCARGPSLEKGAPGPLVCLDPAYSNRLVRALLDARALAGLPTYQDVSAEVRVGASRFDFALGLPGDRRLLLEVKNAAAAAGRAALFPDAPSARAARHCQELAALAREGQQAAIVLVSQRADIEEIRPHPVDPDFAQSLLQAASAGVRILGAAFVVGLDGFRYAGPRPVNMRHP